MRKAVLLALGLTSCVAARPTPDPVHVPKLSARDARAAEAINRQLERALRELASCAPQAVERVSVEGEVTLRAPLLIGVVAHVDATCVGALHPTIETVSFFFDAETGAQLPTVLLPDAQPELERRYRQKAPPSQCEAEDVHVTGFLLQPRADGLLVTPNVGWASRPCVESVVLTWKELDGILSHPPSR